MDYEKKYKEALERAKKALRAANDTGEDVVEFIFPELAESEDERIRKTLIRFFANIKEISESGRTTWAVRKEDAEMCKSFIAYLEKQKPVEWSEEDNIGWDEAFVCVTRAERAAKNEEELQNAVTAEKWLKEIKFKYSVYPVKKEWSEGDKEKLYQVIETILADKDVALREYPLCSTLHEAYDDMVTFLKSLPERFNLQPKQGWSEEDERMLSRCVKSIETSKQFADSGTFKEAKDKETSWLKDLLNRFNLQPKQEWSEEDERDVAEYIYETCDGFTEYSAREVARDILSILQSNHHWKPSEEEMEAFKNSVEHIPNAYYDDMWELYEQLKKL